MPITITLTAPSLGFPAERSFDLWRMLPEFNRREDDEGTGDLRRFISCLQEIVNLQLYEVDHWTDILDRDKAAERYLDAMLLDLGNPFAFDLTEIEKRRLLRVLVSIYRQKGTARGIINVIRFFLGIVVEILCYLDVETWELGTPFFELIPDEVIDDGTDGQIIASTRRFLSATAAFTPRSEGGVIRVTSGVVGNNGDHRVTAYVSPTEVEIGDSTALSDEGPGLTWQERGMPSTLGPGLSWGRYAFEIISPVVLTDEQRKRIVDLATYMKPAHTHLNRIVEPTTPPVYDHLELGISRLGYLDEWDLHG